MKCLRPHLLAKGQLYPTDRQYLKTRFYVSRKMKAWLRGQGYLASRTKFLRLVRMLAWRVGCRTPVEVYQQGYLQNRGLTVKKQGIPLGMVTPSPWAGDSLKLASLEP